MCRYNEAKPYLSQLNFINNARRKEKGKKGEITMHDTKVKNVYSIIMHLERHNCGIFKSLRIYGHHLFLL